MLYMICDFSSWFFLDPEWIIYLVWSSTLKFSNKVTYIVKFAIISVTNKKKVDSRKKSRKRLKKKYALSESEDGAVCQPNTTSDKVDDKISENEQEDQRPISSLFKDTMSNEDFKRCNLLC